MNFKLFPVVVVCFVTRQLLILSLLVTLYVPYAIHYTVNIIYYPQILSTSLLSSQSTQEDCQEKIWYPIPPSRVRP